MTRRSEVVGWVGGAGADAVSDGAADCMRAGPVLRQSRRSDAIDEAARNLCETLGGRNLWVGYYSANCA